MTIDVVEKHKVFSGTVTKYRHFSTILDCEMTFTLFLPQTKKQIPLLWWLSGLTCTDDNFNLKSGFHKYASEQEVAIVMPDTSPRGAQVADCEEWDMGQGASFYLNATKDPWAKHFRMYDYLIDELPQIVESLMDNYNGSQSIMGHSMGGHGALMIGLKNQDRFKSISAFAPITNPMAVPWGINAFTQYLGEDISEWSQWDATELIKEGTNQSILITQGSADNFYEVQLKEQAFLDAAKEASVSIKYHKEEGYDHSYFMISTFIEEHINFHCN